MVAARAMDMLLRPPDLAYVSPPPAEDASAAETTHTASQEKSAAPAIVDSKGFNILVINDDHSECELIAQALGEYTVETVHDGVTGLAKLISFKPDLVILDVDLPIIDGFKVLAHIRSSLNMPIIIVSGSRVRASDRMLSTELGADYYMTKPYSIKELQQKSRQLIARYRGIDSWIITGPRDSHAGQDRPVSGASSQLQHAAHTSPDNHRFVAYNEFAAEVEKRIYIAFDNGPCFSVVGCRLSDMTASAGRSAIRLYEVVRTLIRETDVISTNPRNDMVVLLADADRSGARAFVARLRERVMEELGQGLLVWVRSFPELEESNDPSMPGRSIASSSQFNRRASDRRNRDDSPPAQGPSRTPTGPLSARKAAATGPARSENPNPEN
jgi:DNA-binding response OmpR family regulator